MQTTQWFKKLVLLVSCGAACLLSEPARSSPAPGGPARPRERIGVYDSRAIAVAYAGSAVQEQEMKDLRARFKKATEAGDAKEAARLEAEGQAWQETLHRQGFGTAPVEDILAHLTNDLPAIRKTAGVTHLISKWDKAQLDRHPQAERIDVTMPLVDAFQPKEVQRKRAIEIQRKPPAIFK